jgi:hypothetical protein
MLQARLFGVVDVKIEMMLMFHFLSVPSLPHLEIQGPIQAYLGPSRVIAWLCLYWVFLASIDLIELVRSLFSYSPLQHWRHRITSIVNKFQY